MTRLRFDVLVYLVIRRRQRDKAEDVNDDVNRDDGGDVAYAVSLQIL